MELDTALKFAVILAWEDLMKVTSPCSARVEYRCEPGASLDYLNVWSVGAGGKQDLVCDYWTWTSPAHPSGIRFSSSFHSDQLGQALDFILMNQGQFTRRTDACRDGLALIYPPTADERTEAATWMKGVHGAPTNISRPLQSTSGRPPRRIPKRIVESTGPSPAKRDTVSSRR
jgi:hypothetical protein